jgi:hypothetical protein
MRQMPVPGLSRNCEDFSVDAVLSATLALRAEMLKTTVSTDVKGEVSRGLGLRPLGGKDTGAAS